MSWVAAAVASAALTYSAVSAVTKSSKAKKIARSNKRPNYQIPQAVLDNQRMLESRAGTGLSSTSIDLYKKQSDRQTTSSLEAILKGGGNVNNISELYDTGQTGVMKMALIDDEMRTRNMKALVDQNNTIAAHADKAWQVNEWGPYADKAQAAAALKAQAAQDMSNAFSSAGTVATSIGAGSMYKKEGNNVFSKGTTGVNAGGTGGNRNAGGGGADYASEVPQAYVSRMSFNNPTAAQLVQQKYPGLSGGKRGGLASLDPVFDEASGKWIDPLTNQPLN